MKSQAKTKKLDEYTYISLSCEDMDHAALIGTCAADIKSAITSKTFIPVLPNEDHLLFHFAAFDTRAGQWN